jgi:site-specific recombinase XerD
MEQLFSDIPFEDSFEGMRDRTILELFYATGMRLSELLNIKRKTFICKTIQSKYWANAIKNGLFRSEISSRSY